MGLSSGHTHALPRRGTQILPKAYDKSERLPLEFWDPMRLASHVLATLSPVDQRAAAVNLILEMKITGSFLAHYTYQIEELLPDGDCELVRAIARAIPKTFWVPLRAPRVITDHYTTLWEITDVLRSETSSSRVEEEHIVPFVVESAVPCWVYEEEEEASTEDAEEDLRLPDPSLAGEDATSVDDDYKVELKEDQNNDEAGRGDYQGLEGRGARIGADDGGGYDDRDGTGINALSSWWAQVSLTVRADYSSRHAVGDTFWRWGSHFLGVPRGGASDQLEHERVVMVSGQPRRGRGGVSSTRGGSESTVVHTWMLRCIGLYGL